MLKHFVENQRNNNSSDFEIFFFLLLITVCCIELSVAEYKAPAWTRPLRGSHAVAPATATILTVPKIRERSAYTNSAREVPRLVRLYSGLARSRRRRQSALGGRPGGRGLTRARHATSRIQARKHASALICAVRKEAATHCWLQLLSDLSERFPASGCCFCARKEKTNKQNTFHSSIL